MDNDSRDNTGYPISTLIIWIVLEIIGIGLLNLIVPKELMGL